MDGITVNFICNQILEQNKVLLKRIDEHGNEIRIGELTHTGNFNYKLFIVLPQVLHNTNIFPYDLNDTLRYLKIMDIIKHALFNVFGKDAKQLVVSSIECSMTYFPTNRELVDPMLHYISMAFISTDRARHFYVRGKKSKVSKQTEIYCDGIVCESFHTERWSDGLGSFKCYNKLKEEYNKGNISEDYYKAHGAIRFEWILVKRGVERILGKNPDLWYAISCEGVRKLTLAFIKQLFERDVLFDRLTRLGRDFRKVLKNDVMLMSPKEFVLAHKQIAEIDYSFIKDAFCLRYNKRTAQKVSSRLKIQLKDHIDFSLGTVEELRTMKKMLLKVSTGL